jgi:coenzyme F420-reducing hydrogenase beta subunit
MQPNVEGFIYPTIDKNLCTECGVCDNICPALLDKEKLGAFLNTAQPDAYAVWADDELRLNSSSGGVFGLTANMVWKRGGYVCGAVFTKDHYNVQHFITNNPNDLPRLQNSKYLQSDTLRVYSSIKQLLKTNEEVLFCGCPCQVAGLKTYLGKTDSSRLLTFDLICHGVPNAKIWESYLRERFQNKAITAANFRSKIYGWSYKLILHVQVKNKVDKYINHRTGYFHGFLKNYYLRHCCGTCRYVGTSRLGDLTLADFWAVNKYDPKLNDQLGTSLVLVNTEKGQACLDGLKGKTKLMEKIPLEAAFPGAGTLRRPTPVNWRLRQDFFQHFDESSFSKCLDNAIGRKFDVGLVGWYNPHAKRNFGGALTFYALNQAIARLGYTVAVIARPDATKLPSPSHSLVGHSYRYTDLDSTADDLNALVGCFVVASDQLWNYKYVGNLIKHYALDFVADDVPKISFSTSFGQHYTTFPKTDEGKALKKEFIKLLQRFNFVSTREQSGVELAGALGVKADLVCDPVFLLNESDINSLIDQRMCIGIDKIVPKHLYGTLASSENYLFAYLLDPTQEKMEFLRALAIKNSQKLIIMVLPSLVQEHYEEKIAAAGITTEELWHNANFVDFLFAARRASAMATDSFHGTCFALIFNKPFIITKPSSKRGHTRFHSILDQMNLRETLKTDLSAANDTSFQDFNWPDINKILENMRADGELWLKNALETSLEPQKTTMQVPDEDDNPSKLDIIKKKIPKSIKKPLRKLYRSIRRK